MKAVAPAMNSMIPQASQDLESMDNMLKDMMPSSLNDGYSFADSGLSSQETDSILSEAAAVAGTQVDDKFPSVPSNTSKSMASTEY